MTMTKLNDGDVETEIPETAPCYCTQLRRCRRPQHHHLLDPIYRNRLLPRGVPGSLDVYGQVNTVQLVTN